MAASIDERVEYKRKRRKIQTKRGKIQKKIPVAAKCGFGYIWQHKQMVLLKLLNGFVKVVLCIFHPLLNKTKMKFDQDFKACKTFCFELKVLSKSKYLILNGSLVPFVNFFCVCFCLC